MPIAGPLIGAAGSLAGGAMGANAQGAATNATVQGQRDAMNMQLAMYNQSRADMLPMINARNQALPLYMRLFGLQMPAIGAAGGGGITANVTGASTAPGRGEHMLDTRRAGWDSFRDTFEHGGGLGISGIASSITSGRGDLDRWFGDALMDDPGQLEFSVDNGTAEFLPATGGAPEQSLTDILRATPGYDFARSEGLRGIERSAAARGGLGSGGTLRALTRYGTGLADQTYGDFANRLASLIGLSQTAVTSAGGMGMQAGQNIGANLANIGAARGSGYANTGNIWGNALGGAANSLGQYWNKPQTTTAPTGGGPYNQNTWMNYGYGGG